MTDDAHPVQTPAEIAAEEAAGEIILQVQALFVGKPWTQSFFVLYRCMGGMLTQGDLTSAELMWAHQYVAGIARDHHNLLYRRLQMEALAALPIEPGQLPN